MAEQIKATRVGKITPAAFRPAFEASWERLRKALPHSAWSESSDRRSQELTKALFRFDPKDADLSQVETAFVMYRQEVLKRLRPSDSKDDKS